MDRYPDGESLYAALREQPHTTLSACGGDIAIVFADGAPGLDRERVMEWIRKSAEAVSRYFGQFPVRQVGLLVIADDSTAISGGTTYGISHSAISIHVGRRANETAFRDDWILVHEMTHLACRPCRGKATGCSKAMRRMWSRSHARRPGRSTRAWSGDGRSRACPKASRRPGIRDSTTPARGVAPTGVARPFGSRRTSGFWRRRTARWVHRMHYVAINRRSGGNTADWTVDQVMAAGDAATKTHVLSSLYAAMRSSPAPVDVANLFRQLGVEERDGAIEYSDDAPLASIRRRITEPRQGPNCGSL